MGFLGETTEEEDRLRDLLNEDSVQANQPLGKLWFILFKLYPYKYIILFKHIFSGKGRNKRRVSFGLVVDLGGMVVEFETREYKIAHCTVKLQAVDLLS